MSRVVVTGIGLITPLGNGTRFTWNRLVANKSGLISTTTLPDYDAGWSSIPCKVVGKVPDGPFYNGKWDCLEHLEPAEARRLARFCHFALAATQEALADARLELRHENLAKIGVAVGSGIGALGDTYDNSVAFAAGGHRKVQPLFVPRMLTNMAAGNISIKYGLKGPLHSVATACATGLNAVGDAANFIRNGYADVMVCGGSEACLHPLALSGFARARLVATDADAPELASRPFDGARSGFVLSEGSGILILEEYSRAKARGADIYAEVLGYGLSGEAHHITAPEESGDGAFRAMEMALSRGSVDPAAVDYINAHATSTVIGDRAENNAIVRLFEKNNKLAVSSTKSAIGHLLGAAGAVEAAFTVKAIKESIVPATLNLTNIGGHKDDQREMFERFDYVPLKSKSKNVDYAVCNSFGFGGVNASVVFGKV